MESLAAPTPLPPETEVKVLDTLPWVCYIAHVFA
jgi:hypothetical protein